MKAIFKKVFFLTVCLAGVAGCFGIAAAETDTAEAIFTPWSGYWWPSKHGGLATGFDYRGHPAPLEKYELFANGVMPGQATEWYLENYYDPDAPSWYGLCNGFAAAAVYEKIRFFPSVHDNILFRVGDKKGLISACHAIDTSIRANAHSPDVFHYWLLKYIKDQGVAFYAELDPSEEAWNYPVYRYHLETTKTDNRLNVTCTIWYAGDNVHPDFQGTLEHADQYTYTLFLQGEEVVGGEWTGGSVWDHPQQLIMPVEQVSDNPYLDCDLIREIATMVDDEWESETSVELPPGRYRMVLINDDEYVISSHVGDDLIFHLLKEDTLQEPMQVSVTDGEDREVFTGEVTDSLRFTIQSETPPYRLSVARPAYTETGVYFLEFDLRKSFEFADMKIQKGYGWGGMAIVNPHDTPCEAVYVVGYTRDGAAMETFAGPFALAPGEKRTFLYMDFSARMIERTELFGLKVMAPMRLEVVDLSGRYEKTMSCYNAASADMAVFPDIAARWNTAKSLSWGIYNPGATAETFQLTHYSADGRVVDAESITLEARSTRHFSNTDDPFASVEDDGWVNVTGADGAVSGGYIAWIEGGLAQSEMLSPLSASRRFFIPHAAGNGFWSMHVTLINPDANVNRIAVALLNGGVTDTSEIILNAGEKRTVGLWELFPGADLGASAVSLTGDQDLAGYYAFRNSGDYAFFPLLAEADIHKTLTMPHVASNEYWWTAVNLLNPFDSEVVYDVVPYDETGREMESPSRISQTVEGHSKAVWTLAALFGAQAQSVASVRISVRQGDGLMGILCYGTHDLAMLSGRVMD